MRAPKKASPERNPSGDLIGLFGLVESVRVIEPSQSRAIPVSGQTSGQRSQGMSSIDTELSAAHRQRLYSFILRRVRDAALAEDLTQDTLTRLFEYSSRAEIRNMSALAFKIAENAIRSQFRSAQRRPQAPLDEDMPDTAPGSEQVVMDRQRLEMIQSVIAGLPARRREVLMRRRVHGESYDTIAAAMGLSRAGVEKHLTRALADLRQAVDLDLIQQNQNLSSNET